MAKKKDDGTPPKLTLPQWEALWSANHFETTDPTEGGSTHLTHGVGVHKSTVLALKRFGLMTVENWFDTPWAGGMKETKTEVRWIADLTEEGKRRFATQWSLLKQNLVDATEWSVDFVEIEKRPEMFYLLAHNGTPRNAKNAHPQYNGKEFFTLDRAKWFALCAGLLKVSDEQPPAVEEAPEPEVDLGQPVEHAVTGKLVGWIRDGKFIDAE